MDPLSGISATDAHAACSPRHLLSTWGLSPCLPTRVRSMGLGYVLIMKHLQSHPDSPVSHVLNSTGYLTRVSSTRTN